MISKTTKTTETTATQATAKTEYSVQVTAVRVIKEGTYSFDAEVNGIRIYSMILNEGYKADGSEYSVINFPSRKGNNDKYYSHCWFPISNELKEEFIRQISEKVVV